MDNQPPFRGGNRCGHDPHRPRFGHAIVKTETTGSLSELINCITPWLETCFESPARFPQFCKRTGSRVVRSERREAVIVVLLTLLRHLEPESLLIGSRLPGGRFVGLSMRDIALETGLGQRRCERAISELIRAKALERRFQGPNQPQVLAFASIFFEWMVWESCLWGMERGVHPDKSVCGSDEGRP